jgi:SNF2 family DNA or RNA helicase
MEHFYSVILSDVDPKYRQPDKITVQLKPHQLAGLQKAFSMEQEEYVRYFIQNPRSQIPYGNNQSPNIFGYFNLKTNIGIIGDIVGYGKTLIALSIIAELKKELIHVPYFRKYTYQSSSGYMEITKENTQCVLSSMLINTTLVVVPRGPVYIQWKNTIKQNTKLTCLSIDSLVFIKKRMPKRVVELREYLGRFDIVLIKNTTLVTMINYYRDVDPMGDEIYGFDRIMIDEAHVIIMKIPELTYKFLWLITSSYRDLIMYNYSKTIYASFLEMIQHNIERLHYVLIKGDTNFVKSSFEVPPPLEKYYVCKMSKNLTAIQPFLTPAISEFINVNDIAGAIKELGGLTETADDLVKLVLADINKHISNTQMEIDFVQMLELERENKEARLNTLRNELSRYVTRKESIEDRLNEVSTKMCSICYDALENPIYLNCSHMFCGQCIFNWIHMNSRTTRSVKVQCPECRTDIDSSKIVAIVKEKVETDTIVMIMSKEDQLIDIIKKKPEGRFLIFSRMDTSFGRLSKVLQQNEITHTEIKGSTSHMMHILEEFVAKRITVILLNTYHAGCGIDISSATDVIIFHSMPQEKIQAVGRAQRVGRTDQLTIHNLCYPHEMK